MQISHLLNYAFALLAVSLSAPHPAHSQEKTAPSPAQAVPASAYPNTAEGLRQLLQDARAAAKSGDKQKVAAFVKDMEIPNCEAWLYKMYAPDKAESWLGLCEAKTLGPNEKSMQELFAQLAKDEGEILTRKVNDNPEPGKGMEWGWLQAIRQPLDIYFASWKTPQDPKASKGDPIGYFMFIDEGFRWESDIQFVKPRISNLKVVPAKMVKKVDPVYPSEAAAQHVSGTVRVYFVIGADGMVYNAHAISGEGLSNDSSLRKAAEDAVFQWRYQPATLGGKPVQTNAVTVDIVFSPKN